MPQQTQSQALSLEEAFGQKPKTKGGAQSLEDAFGEQGNDNTLMQSRQEASKSTFEANKPESTWQSRLLSGLEGAGFDAHPTGTDTLVGTAKRFGQGLKQVGDAIVQPLTGGGTSKGVELLKNTVMAPYEGAKEAYQGIQENDADKAMHGIGQAAATGVPLVEGIASGLKAVKPSVTEAAGNLNRRYNPMAIKSPEAGVTQAVKPGITGMRFQEALPDALRLIEDHAARTGNKLGSLDDGLSAIKGAKQEIWNQIEQTNPQMRNFNVDASSIADEMDQSVGSRTRLQDPNKAAKISERADTYRSQPFKVQQLEDHLEQANAELSQYYAQNNLRRWDDLAKHPDTAATYAEAGKLRDIINTTLDSQADGAGIAELKRRYGALRQIEEPVMRRNIIGKQANPNSLAEQGKFAAIIRDAFGGALVGAGTGGVKGAVAGGLSGAVAGAGEYALTRWLSERQRPDSIFRRSMAGMKHDPLPPVNVEPTQAPAGLLPERTSIDVGPAPDTSGVRGVPGQYGRELKQLPAQTGGPYATGEVPPTPQPGQGLPEGTFANSDTSYPSFSTQRQLTAGSINQPESFSNKIDAPEYYQDDQGRPIRTVTGRATPAERQPVEPMQPAEAARRFAAKPEQKTAQQPEQAPKAETPATDNLNQRVNDRNTLHHSTDLQAGESILQDGEILSKGADEKLRGWGKSTTPSVAAERVGFTKPVTSFSRAQRVSDAITFEVDPDYVKQSRPVQGLSQDRKASGGTFEFETATQHPVPAEGIKKILINRPRAEEMHGIEEANARITKIKALAEKRGIPVVEGSASELLQRRVRGGDSTTTPKTRRFEKKSEPKTNGSGGASKYVFKNGQWTKE